MGGWENQADNGDDNPQQFDSSLFGTVLSGKATTVKVVFIGGLVPHPSGSQQHKKKIN